MATSYFKTSLDTKFVGSRHCSAAFSLQVPKSCTDLDLTLLYIPILGKYSRFVRENELLALGVCFPQPCSSAGCWSAASRSRWITTKQLVRFRKNEFNEMLCKLDSLSSHVRSNKPQPCLEEIYQTLKRPTGHRKMCRIWCGSGQMYQWEKKRGGNRDLEKRRTRDLQKRCTGDLVTIETRHGWTSGGTEWPRPIARLIIILHFPGKSPPITSGSLAKNDLQLKASHGSSPTCSGYM